MTTLVSPSVLYKESYLKGLKELIHESPNPDAIKWQIDNFDEYISNFNILDNVENITNGIVPYSEYWLIENGEYIGTIVIRHKPSGRLESIKSHIYFHIIPSKREKGYGLKILELGLVKARKLGLKDIIITCNYDNVASRKIIEQNGGIFIEDITVPDGPVMNKYVIK